MDKVSKEVRSKIMSKIKSKNTSPEIMLRKILWERGLRYRIHYGLEKIDVAFPTKKIAIFIDGCFWHSCSQHSHIPQSNREYWVKKLKRNVDRAKLKDERLKAQGWMVIHFWEHEFKEKYELIEKIDSIQNMIINLK